MVEQEENTCVVLDDDISSSLLGHFQENVTPADEDEFDYDGDDFWPLNDDEGQDFWPLSTFCVAFVMVFIICIFLIYGTLFFFFFWIRHFKEFPI